MWSTDGMVLAVGHEDGVVTLRDKAGAEKQRLQRDAPVWGFAWAPEPTTKEMRLW